MGVIGASCLQLHRKFSAFDESCVFNMANKPRGFGLTAELAKKKAEKFDAGRSNEAMEWLVAVLEYGEPGSTAGPMEVSTMEDVQKHLKDGSVLCKVVKILYPGSIKKINKIDNPNSPFKISKENENINNFLKACECKANCHKGDLFKLSISMKPTTYRVLSMPYIH